MHHTPKKAGCGCRTGAQERYDVTAVRHLNIRQAIQKWRPVDYFRRCQRVFLSILRCLCLDAFFLRHFLTEPTVSPPSVFME